jgi:hypothetical protein
MEKKTQEIKPEAEVKKEEPKASFPIVVKELPKTEVRQVELQDGSIRQIITEEEAITEMYAMLSKIVAAVC